MKPYRLSFIRKLRLQHLLPVVVWLSAASLPITDAPSEAAGATAGTKIGTLQSVNVPMKTLVFQGDPKVFKLANNCLVERNGVVSAFGNFSVAAGERVTIKYQPVGQQLVTHITITPFVPSDPTIRARENADNTSPLPQSRRATVASMPVVPDEPSARARENARKSSGVNTLKTLPGDPMPPAIGVQGGFDVREASGKKVAGQGDPMPVVPGSTNLAVGVASTSQVNLESDDGMIVATTKTGADGKFEFKDLKAGNYRLAIPKGAPARVATGASADAPQPASKRGLVLTDLRGLGGRRLPIDPKTGLSPTITVSADGGSIAGTVINGMLDFGDDDGRAKELIERVDVLTGGASSVYGSDAIAGVVNFKKMAAGPTLTNVNGTNTLLLGVTTEAPAGGGGLTITSVADGGLAQRLGLQQRDLLRAVNGNQLNSHEDLVTQLRAAAKALEAAGTDTPKGAPLDLLSFRLIRGGKNQTVTLRRDGAWYVGGEFGGIVQEGGFEVREAGDVAQPEPNAWRFKQLPNGKWLYYGLDEKWVINENGKWNPYTPDAGDNLSPSAVPGTGGARLPKAGAAITNRALGIVGGANGNGKADTKTATPGGAVPGRGFIPAPPGRKAPAGGKSPSPAGGLRGAFGS